MMTRIPGHRPPPMPDTPVLRFAKHETGTIEVLTAWYPHITIAQTMIDNADPAVLRESGTSVIFNCTNGGAEYELSAPNGVGDRAGTLIRSW